MTFESCQGQSHIIVQHFILNMHMGDVKRLCLYLLALGTALYVGHPYILNDFLLTVAQIPCLCHMQAVALFLIRDGIRGLAHSLGSSLSRKIMLSSCSQFVICSRQYPTNLLQLVDIVRLLEVEL